MKSRKETIPEAIERFSREYRLDREQIMAYADAFAAAWHRERKAMNSRHYRLRKSQNAVTDAVTQTVTQAVTDAVTQTVTQAVTPDKEERNEKENLPPTPPIREKAKKEETLTLRASVARACMCERQDVPNLVTVLNAAPLAGVDEAYARWWHAEMTARDWTNTNGSRIDNRNWRAVIRAWFVRNDPNERAAARKAADEARRAETAARIAEEALACDKWILCAERCANFDGRRCVRGMKMPPDMLDPPRPPEECPLFTRTFCEKEVAI